MATEPRRSTRARSQVKSYADEQAEQIQQAEAKPKPQRKKRSKPLTEDDDAEHDDADFTTSVGDIDQPLETESPKPKKRAKKSKESAQLYGYAAEGTIIPWGTKTRKQPKIYEVRKQQGQKKDNLVTMTNEAAENRVAWELANIRKLADGEEETRLRDYEDELPDWYHPALEKAREQKMYILERSREFEQDCHAHHAKCPCEILRVAGSSGNVYTVRISHLTTCTCPVGLFSKKGGEKQCKHVLYVLHQVLKAPEHLAYQAAFLHSELKELFANAPPLPTAVADAAEDNDGKRKEVSGDCPICFTEFEEGEDITWCKAACGNNVHTACFKQWENSRRQAVTCPFCRSQWEYDNNTKAQKSTITKVNEDLGARDRGGYLNVANQLDYD